MSLAPSDIEALSTMVMELCGISLDSSKEYLMESRFGRILEEEDLRSFGELAIKARDRSNTHLRSRVVDAITTNETLFFRDNSPFDAMRFKVIPEAIDRALAKGRHELRIWSAACSTGQEPYSLAITLMETMPDIQNWRTTILATDISDEALAKASRGWYSEMELSRGLGQDKLNKYFTPDGKGWRIKDEVRYHVAFQKRNLMEPFPERAFFDVVLCRNVVIYFTPEARRDIFHRIAGTMDQDGVLFVGSSETLADLGGGFQPQIHCGTVYYQPNRVETGHAVR